MTSQTLFSAAGLAKRYGQVTVLDDVSLTVESGEIHALLGANGAGKSTAVRIIAGLVGATAGEMRMKGQPYAPRKKREAEVAGVHIVQQELNLIPTLSVAENLFFTRLPHTAGILRRGKLQEQSHELLDRCGLPGMDPSMPLGRLGVGRQQMVEIAAALDQDCRLLILDEPTAALSAAETERLFHWLEQLRDKGVGMVYISHRLDEVSRLADRITVLRDGKRVGTYGARELTADQWVERMSGESAAQIFHHQSYAQDARVLEVNGMGRDWIQNVTFHLCAGERLGIAGLVGSGRTELLRLLYGADQAKTGAISVCGGEPRRFRHPREAVRDGLVLVTEDRKADGLMLPLSVRANASLAALADGLCTLGWVRRQQEAQDVAAMCERLDIRCQSSEQPANTLSGGNQQKVVMAKWLLRDGEVFLLDEPTRGIDVAARRRIYRLMETLARAGKGIVAVSSDLDELMETCDRILVMSHGRMVAEYSRNNWNRDEILRASFAGYRSGTEASFS